MVFCLSGAKKAAAVDETACVVFFFENESPFLFHALFRRLLCPTRGGFFFAYGRPRRAKCDCPDFTDRENNVSVKGASVGPPLGAHALWPERIADKEGKNDCPHIRDQQDPTVDKRRSRTAVSLLGKKKKVWKEKKKKGSSPQKKTSAYRRLAPFFFLSFGCPLREI